MPSRPKSASENCGQTKPEAAFPKPLPENLTEFWTRVTTTQRQRRQTHVCQILCEPGNSSQVHAPVREPPRICHSIHARIAERLLPLFPGATLAQQTAKAIG